MSQEEHKGNSKEENFDALTGDFSNVPKAQCIAYLLSLNDPSNPFYDKLEVYDIDILRLWATRAWKVYQTLKGQTLINEGVSYIPAMYKQVPLPTSLETATYKSNSNDSNNNNDANDSSNSNSNNPNSGNMSTQQPRGRKQQFTNIEYGSMQQNQGSNDQTVITQEAAQLQFRGGGAAVHVQADVEQLMGTDVSKYVSF